VDPVDHFLAGATPYLRMCGIVTGGWLLARSALAAQRCLDGDLPGNQLLEQKMVTARFYCDQLLPQAAGLRPAVTAGPAGELGRDPAAGDVLVVGAGRPGSPLLANWPARGPNPPTGEQS
jgi:hypothetical protein